MSILISLEITQVDKIWLIRRMQSNKMNNDITTTEENKRVFLEAFEVPDHERQRLTNEVLLLVDEIIKSYALSKPIQQTDIQIRKEVARRILDAIQEDIESI